MPLPASAILPFVDTAASHRCYPASRFRARISPSEPEGGGDNL